MKKAIIVGASSGIGRELAILLSNDQYVLGLVARRAALLNQLKNELKTDSLIKCIDIADHDEAMNQLDALIKEMNGVELIVITSGIGHINEELDWQKEKETIDVNVSGVTALINVVFKHFIAKNSGQLVVVSSVAALRGGGDGPAYSASKAYLANYLEGMNCKIKRSKLNIVVTDIRPGLVDTDMAKGSGLFWVQPVEKAACQIYRKIRLKKKVAYVTKRWRIVAFVLKRIPAWIYCKL